MNGELTVKQAMFVAEFLLDGNATRAAIAAGVPEASASVTSSRWLRNRKVAAIIGERQAKRTAKLEITAETVLQELAKLAFHDPGKLYDAEGRLKPVHQLDDTTRAAVASVEVEEKQTRGARSVTKKVKLADKGQNLERLGRYLKLFTDRLEHGGRLTLEQLVCGDDGKAEDSGGEQAA
jgi:phage terminase small subunit